MLRGTLLVITLGALLLAPAATAQEPPETPPLANFSIGLSASPSNDPVTPITETRTTSVDVTITCEQGSVYGGTTPAGTPEQVTYDVNTTYELATVSWAPMATSLEFAPEECLQGAETNETVDVTVTFPADARADDTATIELTATLPDGTTETVTWDHTVGHYFNSQVRVDPTIHKDEPGATIEIPGTIENLGNADVTYTFALLPDDGRRLDVTMPDPVTVAAFDEGTFTVTIEIPPSDSSINRQDDVVFQVTPALASSPEVTDDPVQNSIVVQTEGGAEESPGPVLPFLVVFGAALWAGRRRTCSTV